MSTDISHSETMHLGLVAAGGMSPLRAVALAAEAEASGLDSFWVTEGAGGDAFSLLAAAAASTSAVRLGTSIVNVYSRTPTVLAMAALTLNELSRGRFVFGLGTSHVEQLSNEHGVPRQQPLRRIADVVEVTRLLQETSQLVEVSLPTVRVSGFRPSFSPNANRFPIYLAAIGPEMMRVALRVADGVILIWRTPDDIARLREAFPRSHLACVLHCAVDRNETACAEALARARARHSKFANYRRYFEAQESPAGISCTSSDDLLQALDLYARAGLDEALLMPVPCEDMDAEATSHVLVGMAGAITRNSTTGADAHARNYGSLRTEPSPQ